MRARKLCCVPSALEEPERVCTAMEALIFKRGKRRQESQKKQEEERESKWKIAHKQ